MTALAIQPRPPAPALTARPMRAIMLGCGVVGGGVAHRLPASVRLEGVLVTGKRCDLPYGVPVYTDLDAVLALKPDLVIEALPGGAFAEAALERAVAQGCHVVTANKDVAARRPDLARQAAAKGRGFVYSAAVGGGVPVIETIAKLVQKGEEIDRVRGVLNGTSNFVLDRLAAGESLGTAVKAAQDAGFAEADPSADLDGVDAANKLALIARTAWGIDLDPASISRQSIRDLPEGLPAKAAREGKRVRQVGHLARHAGGVHAAVRLETVDLDDPVSRARLEGNCVVVSPVRGYPVILSGKGAGRAPTAASVLGDIKRLCAVC
ncbi:hypothetical protein FKB34_12815 [Glycocaulis profundi]|nr:hypothetical protein FKB34_12815 [Glycocaulis profundi]